MGGLGGFGALFDLKAAGFADPVLVSTTDGVGTKLKVAIETGHARHASASTSWPCASTISWCRAPSRCSSSTISPPAGSSVGQASAVIGGIAEGCRQAGCALVGGETAEMPGMYAARAITTSPASRSVRRSAATLLPRAVAPGDARARAGELRACIPTGSRWCDGSCRPAGLGWDDAGAVRAGGIARRGADGAHAHLRASRCWRCTAPACCKAAAHITGGGLPGNLPRVLPEGTEAVLDRPWPVPPVFRWLAARGGVAAGGDAARVQLRRRHGAGGRASRIAPRRCCGRRARRCSGSAAIEAAASGRRVPFDVRASPARPGAGRRMRRRAAILISGRGSNMAALIEAARSPGYPAEIALVAVEPARCAGAAPRGGRRHPDVGGRPPRIRRRPRGARGGDRRGAARGRASSWSASPATCGC